MLVRYRSNKQENHKVLLRIEGQKMLNDSETLGKPIGGYRLTEARRPQAEKEIYEPSIFDPLAYEYKLAE